MINYFFSGSNDQLNLLSKKFGEPTCSITPHGLKKFQQIQHMIASNKLYLGNFEVNWNEVPSVSKEILDKFANKKLFKKIKGKWMPKFEIK